MRRTGAGRHDTEILIRAGCFSSIETHNVPQMIFIARKYRERADRCRPGSIGALIDTADSITPPPMKNISLWRQLCNEQDAFGYIVSRHPMAYFRTFIKEPVVLARDLPNYAGRRAAVAGILITAKTVLTRQDDLMQFVSFEDETAIFEAVFFPKAYRKFAALLDWQCPYILYGTADVAFGVVTFNIDDIKVMGDG